MARMTAIPLEKEAAQLAALLFAAVPLLPLA